MLTVLIVAVLVVGVVVVVARANARAAAVEDAIRRHEKCLAQFARLKSLEPRLDCLQEAEGFLEGAAQLAKGSAKVREAKERVDALRVGAVLDEVAKFEERAQRATSLGSRERTLQSALALLEQYAGYGGELYAQKAEDTRLVISSAKYATGVRRAEREEFKGNMRKALAEYKDALFDLLHDDVADDAQISEIGELEERIAALERDAKAPAGASKRTKEGPDSAPAKGDMVSAGSNQGQDHRRVVALQEEARIGGGKVEVACPKCGAVLSLPPGSGGKSARCAACGGRFIVPLGT